MLSHCGEIFTALCPLCLYTCTYSKIHTNAVFHCCQHLSFQLFSQPFDSLTFYLLFSVFSSVSLFLPFCPIIHLSSVFFLSLSIPLYFFPFSSFSFQRTQSHGVQSTSQDGNPKSRESHRQYVTLP